MSALWRKAELENVQNEAWYEIQEVQRVWSSEIFEEKEVIIYGARIPSRNT